MPAPLLTVAQVAERLACSEATARRVIRQMRYVKIGKLVRVDPAVLERFIAEGGSTVDRRTLRKKAEPATPGEPHPEADTPKPPAKDAEYFARLKEKYGRKRKSATQGTRLLPIEPRTRPRALLQELSKPVARRTRLRGLLPK